MLVEVGVDFESASLGQPDPATKRTGSPARTFTD